MEDDLPWKTTFHKRTKLKIIMSWNEEYYTKWNISLSTGQMLPTFLGYQSEDYLNLNWRQPLMKDDLKSLKWRHLQIIKVKYLHNHLLDYAQILNLILDDQTKFYKA
jgi:hypothetical protein